MTFPRQLELNSFILLRDELLRRLRRPIGDVSYWLYIIISIVILGGIGIWLEFYKFWSNDSSTVVGIRTALNVYFPALTGASAMQLVLGEGDKKYLRAFGVALIVIFLLLAFFLIDGENHLDPSTSFVLGGTASLIAVLLCWIANADVLSLQDRGDIDAPVGGSVDAPLAGDVHDFKT